ncbi:alpha/beta hydrolase [Jiulongibacter sediminis]|uniref:Alpha/beta hydrolase n=1 Tax=Jiulongibacter sediminis TaxID=1605367 RepID=A0A0P7C713_9BACT|nr:alpha/beta hydrolase [Jiulongibacter sediminis]
MSAQPPLRRAFQPEGVVNKIPYGNNPSAGKYAQAGDANIYYEVYGKGSPIVILHGGILGSTIEMAPFIDSLRKDHQVIAISTRGHGKSEMGQFPITYDKKADDIAAVINAVTSQKVMVLGFSDGAYSAYKLAAKYPEKISKMIAIGAGEQIPGLRSINFDHQMLLSDKAYWKQQNELMPEPERLEDFWNAMQEFYNGMTASKELFNAIQCPVLVLSGELDRNAPLMTVISAYQMIPNAQLSIIPNTGHVCFHENFEAVWAVVKPFIR